MRQARRLRTLGRSDISDFALFVFPSLIAFKCLLFAVGTCPRKSSGSRHCTRSPVRRVRRREGEGEQGRAGDRDTGRGHGEARRRKVRTKEVRLFMPVAGAEEGRAFLEKGKKKKRKRRCVPRSGTGHVLGLSSTVGHPRPQDHHRRVASRHKWRSPGHFQVDRGLSRGENTTLMDLHPRRNYGNTARRKKKKNKKINNGSGAFF